MVKTRPLTTLVVVLAIAADVVLIPLGHGPDFVAWDIATRATLDGVNIYAQHPPGYLTGPFAYPPLFLYLELPLQYLAIHAHLPFTVLGKLPIVAADFVCAWMIARGTGNAERGTRNEERGTSSDRVVALSVALYLLNPLVLYNSAFYGRFDSVCLAFFLIALGAWTRERRGAFAVAYAAAIATKIFPAFVSPWFWWNDPKHRIRTFAVVIGTLALISAPYLIGHPRPFLTDILFVNINQYAQGLSWQVAFMGKLPPQAVLAVSYGFLAIFLVAANNWIGKPLVPYCLSVLLLFDVLSKVVYEQYLVWAIPFLILARDRRPTASMALLAALVVGGMISNPHIHPFGEEVIAVNIALALCIGVFLWTDRRTA